MIDSISDKHKVSPLKIVPNAQISETANHKWCAIGSDSPNISSPTQELMDQINNLLSFKREPSVIIENKLFSSRIFPITFSYLKRLRSTKVMKVIYKGDRSIYKVVLRSMVSPGSGICWLQLNAEGWAILLGQGLDRGLIQAITLAIDSQE